jgi:hypothetical protein
MTTFTLSYQPFLDTYNKCYKNIITTNIIPQGPLRNLVRQIKIPPLSPFQSPGPCNPIQKCGLAITTLGMYDNYYTGQAHCEKYGSGCGLMTPDELPNLFSFLLEHGYQIETQLTNMLNQTGTKISNKNVIGIVTYYGSKTPNIVYMR